MSIDDKWTWRLIAVFATLLGGVLVYAINETLVTRDRRIDRLETQRVEDDRATSKRNTDYAERFKALEEHQRASDERLNTHMGQDRDLDVRRFEQHRNGK